MLNKSAILRFFFALIRKIKDIYYGSALARSINRFAEWAKSLVSNSNIWQLVKRKDYISKIWELSGVFKLFNRLINLPTRLGRKLYDKYKTTFPKSFIISFIKIIFGRFEILIALFLMIVTIIPHVYWNNLYSTMGVFLLVFLYFIKTVFDKFENFDLKAMAFALVLFIITIVLATATSIFPADSLKFFLFYATCFLLVLIIVSSVKTGEELTLLLEIFLVGVTISGLYAIWQAKVVGVVPDTSLTDITLNEGMPGRAYSTMGNPNNFAELLILTLPFYAAVIFNAKTIGEKIIFAFFALPPLMALLYTGSRSGWISFAVAGFVYVFLKNRKLIPLIFVLGIAFFPFLPESVHRRIATIWNPNDTSATYRGYIYDTVKPMLRDFWSTGIGLGPAPFMKVFQRYYEYMNQYADMSILVKIQNYLFTTTIPPHSHNLFLQTWLEAGLAGIGSLIWFITRMFKNCMINIFNKTDEAVNNILMAGVAAMAGILVMGLVEYVWFYPRIMLIFWAVVGIILAGLNIVSKPKCR